MVEDNEIKAQVSPFDQFVKVKLKFLMAKMVMYQ